MTDHVARTRRPRGKGLRSKAARARKHALAARARQRAIAVPFDPQWRTRP